MLPRVQQLLDKYERDHEDRKRASVGTEYTRNPGTIGMEQETTKKKARSNEGCVEDPS